MGTLLPLDRPGRGGGSRRPPGSPPSAAPSASRELADTAVVSPQGQPDGFVPELDPLFERGGEFLQGAEHPAFQASSLQFSKPPLNLVDPGGLGRREVQPETRAGQQPALHRRCLVSGISRRSRGPPGGGRPGGRSGLAKFGNSRGIRTASAGELAQASSHPRLAAGRRVVRGGTVYRAVAHHQGEHHVI